MLCTVVSNPLYKSGGSIPALISGWGPSSENVRVRKASSARDPGEGFIGHMAFIKASRHLTFEDGKENSTSEAVQEEVQGGTGFRSGAGQLSVLALLGRLSNVMGWAWGQAEENVGARCRRQT